MAMDMNKQSELKSEPIYELTDTPIRVPIRGSLLHFVVRDGNSQPITIDFDGEEFLIGGAEGCDLKLPGSNLPATIALIQNTDNQPILRKLSPAVPIFVNTSPLTSNTILPLRIGDIISIGAVDLILEQSFTHKNVAVPISNKENTGNTANVEAPSISHSRFRIVLLFEFKQARMFAL